MVISRLLPPLLLVPLLGGCGDMITRLKGEEEAFQAQSRVTVTEASYQGDLVRMDDEGYPLLASVPGRPDTAPSLRDAAAARAELEGDSAAGQALLADLDRPLSLPAGGPTPPAVPALPVEEAALTPATEPAILPDPPADFAPPVAEAAPPQVAEAAPPPVEPPAPPMAESAPPPLKPAGPLVTVKPSTPAASGLAALLYFDEGKTSLNAQATGLVQKLVAMAGTRARYRVEGFASVSGDGRQVAARMADFQAAQDRADAVAAALKAAGVPAGQVAVKAHADPGDRPAHPRRAEIWIE